MYAIRSYYVLERADLGHAPVDQHVHVQREAHLEFRVAEQHAHQLRRVDGAGARLKHDAHVIGAFVAHIGQRRHLLRLDQLGQPLDQLRLLNLIGNLGDDSYNFV